MKYDAFGKDELISLIELKDADIKKHKNTITELNAQVATQKALIERLSINIKERDDIIKNQDKIITNNENRIQELEMTVKDIKDQRDALRNANCHSGRYPWGPKPGRLSDQINLIEKRLNEIENYIFGGNKND